MRKWMIAATAMLVLGIAGCSDDGGSSAPATTTTPTTVATGPLRVLVTNDDGVAAPGIDALVEALRALPETEVTVVAPATNQSGSGSKTTPGDLRRSDASTASGYRAIAVNGYPADSIVFALGGGVPQQPHVVISGINEGQNLGTVIPVSGTVGAARAAAERGVPALAVSQGLGTPPDYASGVNAVLDWLAEHRTELLTRPPGTGATVTNLNIPTCPAGEPRDVVVVPVDGDENGVAEVDCVTPYASPATDVDAFLHGYIARTDDLAAASP
jgi:5'-nucleotidase